MQNRVALTALLALTTSCTIGASTQAGTTPSSTPVPVATAPVAPAAPVDTFPRTGGPTKEAAELMTIGTPVEGVVTMGHELFYKLEVQAGVPINFAYYTEGLWTGRAGMNMYFNFLDAYGGKLFPRSVAVYATHATSDFDKSAGVFTPKASGTVYLQVDCIEHCKADVHYKIITN